MSYKGDFSITLSCRLWQSLSRGEVAGRGGGLGEDAGRGGGLGELQHLT